MGEVIRRCPKFKEVFPILTAGPDQWAYMVDFGPDSVPVEDHDSIAEHVDIFLSDEYRAYHANEGDDVLSGDPRQEEALQIRLRVGVRGGQTRIREDEESDGDPNAAIYSAPIAQDWGSADAGVPPPTTAANATTTSTTDGGPGAPTPPTQTTLQQLSSSVPGEPANISNSPGESNEAPAPDDEQEVTLQHWELLVAKDGSACVNIGGGIEKVNMKKLNVWPSKLRHHDVVFKGQPPPKRFLDAVIKTRAEYLAAPLAARWTK